MLPQYRHDRAIRLAYGGIFGVSGYKIANGVNVFPKQILVCLALVALAGVQGALCQNPATAQDKPIPPGTKVYIAPVEGGFENYLAAAIHKKKVPLVIVTVREKAELEISGVAESEKAGWAKMLFLGVTAAKEQAGVKVVNLKTHEIVFAYALYKYNSARGHQSAAEAFAKHLKKKMEAK